MFVRVPEPKVAKNRIHLDVMSPDPAAEVARLIQLGGTQVSGCDGPRRTTSTWSWRRDPERNAGRAAPLVLRRRLDRGVAPPGR
ncbi:MAG: hypothetical protein M3415_05820 [Actinomycetota bacterium]|nr:hypothetical protein [Actinomycetota bacterium]